MLTYTLHQTHLPLRFPLSLDGWNYYLISCVASTKEGNKIVAFHLFTKTFSHERRTKSHLFSVSSIYLVQWTLVIVNSVLSPILLTNERCSLCYKTIAQLHQKCLLMRDCLLYRRLLLPESTVVSQIIEYNNL